MSQGPSIGIERLLAIDYYVRDLQRARAFLTGKLGFEQIGASRPEAARRTRSRGAILRSGGCTLIVSEPVGRGGAAFRFLQRHPEGIGALTFAVEDAPGAFARIEERGGTPLSEIATFVDEGGVLSTFSIATPLGDTVFRFVERRGYRGPFPGFSASGSLSPRPPPGFGVVDHVTVNLRTMAPALLWLEHVLGFERFWEVTFHTREVTGGRGGSGLRSTVMWDPRSGVKIAANEPRWPSFRASQIDRFVERHGGGGVQHAAVTATDIVSTVRALRDRGVGFRRTPPAYYDALPDRLRESGVGRIDESVAALRELEILVDGSAPGRYLLQIFLEESALALGDPSAGPFFFEIIERKGDPGFGAGNFRALFEGIEREQRKDRAGARRAAT
jgi:4-hydroxyphenylpyruvate dioxygenase